MLDLFVSQYKSLGDNTMFQPAPPTIPVGSCSHGFHVPLCRPFLILLCVVADAFDMVRVTMFAGPDSAQAVRCFAPCPLWST